MTVILMAVMMMGVNAAPEIKWVSKNEPVGTATAAVYSDGYVFVTEGTALGEYDVSDPQNPIKVKSLPILGGYQAQRLAVRGKYLFVGCAHVIRVYDISDKSNPIDIAGFRHANAYCQGISVDDNYLYVCAHSNGLKILRASDAELDAMSRETPGGLTAVYAPANRAIGVTTAQYLKDGMLYVCTNPGAADINAAFMVYDVSEAAAPKLKGYCELKHIGNPSKGLRMSSIALKGNYAYVGTNDAQAQTTTSGASNGIYVFDVSSAKNNTSDTPVIMNYINLVQIENINYPRRISGLLAYGDYLIANDQDSQCIRLYSIKNPASPIQIAAVKTQSGEKNGAIASAINDNMIYVADNSAGFGIYKISGEDILLSAIKNGEEVYEIEDGEIYAKAKISNFTAAPKKCSLILAVYNGGKLEECKAIWNTDIPAATEGYEITTDAAEIPMLHDGYSIKIFTVDGGGALRPLGDILER